MSTAAASLSALNRRVHARSAYPGVLHLQSMSDAGWFPVYGQDISAGGFAFYSEISMARGERVNVSLAELPTITITATVRHVKAERFGFNVGIEFDEVLPAEIARLLL